MNEEHLNCYAELLVKHAAGLRPGQILFIRCRLVYRDFAMRVGEAAYRAGAALVRYGFFDPEEAAQLVRHGRPERVTLFQVQAEAWNNEILSCGGAAIFLEGVDQPRLAPALARDHPDTYALLTRAMSATNHAFQSRAIESRLCPWVVAPVPSRDWARCVFPELDEDAAMERFADVFFHVVGADRPDALERAAARERRLKAGAAALDQLEIRELHVTGGGNDFRVRLSEKARWWGGGCRTAGGQDFQPNFPTFEIFTIPDRRATSGRLTASKPVPLRSGLLVENLVLEFREGRLVELRAGAGEDVLRRWLATDEGARALGEFALVPDDSPIAGSGLLFHYPLFDENAAAHVALGRGTRVCLRGSEMMSSEELQAAGCNQSTIHVDVVFGSADVRIVATESRKGEVVLFDQGLRTAPASDIMKSWCCEPSSSI
ncbi:MAG: aminopeptidase [bacterium]|nr:aminopeptidase [bacterium]